MNLKTIDLCAGIGGIRRGFELAGDYRNIASAEIDEMACKTYEHLFHEDPRNDVTSEEFKKHLQTLRYDVLMAGFPCQAYPEEKNIPKFQRESLKCKWLCY